MAHVWKGAKELGKLFICARSELLITILLTHFTIARIFQSGIQLYPQNPTGVLSSHVLVPSPRSDRKQLVDFRCCARCTSSSEAQSCDLHILRGNAVKQHQTRLIRVGASVRCRPTLLKLRRQVHDILLAEGDA